MHLEKARLPVGHTKSVKDCQKGIKIVCLFPQIKFLSHLMLISGTLSGQFLPLRLANI